MRDWIPGARALPPNSTDMPTMKRSKKLDMQNNVIQNKKHMGNKIALNMNTSKNGLYTAIWKYRN